MIEFKRIYIDTSPYIYYLEKNPQYSDKVKDFFIKVILSSSGINLTELDMIKE